MNYKPNFEYDVFVGFETIEHLTNYDNFVRLANNSKKYSIISVPLGDTSENTFHLHNFDESVKDLFVGELIHEEIQNDRYLILVYKR